jgi:hypothetical protein
VYICRRFIAPFKNENYLCKFTQNKYMMNKGGDYYWDTLKI